MVNLVTYYYGPQNAIPQLMEYYTQQEIDKISEEIERQWRYHLMVRAVFPNRVELAAPSWKSVERDYYRRKDIRFEVTVPEFLPETMELGLEGITHWLNQNYIIRLFGILDEHGMIKLGRPSRMDNPFIQIVDRLRHCVGAHTSGYRPIQGKYAKDGRKAAKLIMDYLDPDHMEIRDDAQVFLIPIDLLELLKDRCKDFARSLENEPKLIPQ